jgi:hypothetical protein
METDPVTCPPTSRPFVASVLALWKDLTLKEIGAPAGMSRPLAGPGAARGFEGDPAEAPDLGREGIAGSAELGAL